MQRLGRIMEHHRLVLRMGQVVGSDVVTGHEQGRLSQRDWADMVRRCQGCEWACACENWLEHNETANEAPRTCPNRTRFANLKQQDSRKTQ